MMTVLVFVLGFFTGLGTAIGIGLWINSHKRRGTKLGLRFLEMDYRVRENKWER